MHHKKGKPPHGRAGPKRNKSWKLGRFGRGNPDAEPSGDHRRGDVAGREAADFEGRGRDGSRRLFKLVRVGSLVPAGEPVEFTRLPDSETGRVQPLAPESETLLGYLRLHDDGSLSYEEIRADDKSAGDILDEVHDIIRAGRDAVSEVVPRMGNYIRSMSNHLADTQWKELSAADEEPGIP